MSQSSTHHLFKAVTVAQTRRAWRRTWLALVLSVVCGFGAVTADAKPMSESAIQSRIVRADDVGVVLQTRRGDSLRTIAQYYSVKHNIPFKQALELLTQTNQAQFPGGNPDRMQVGAQIILPKLGVDATQTQPTTTDATAVTSAASDTGAANNTAPAETAVTPVTNVNAANVNEHAASAQTAATAPIEPTASTPASTASAQGVIAQGVFAQLKAWFLRVPKSLWLVILPALLLSVLVGLMMRRSRRDKEDSETDPSASALAEKKTASTVTAVPDTNSSHSDERIADETVHSWLKASEKPVQTVTEPVQPVQPIVVAPKAAQEPITAEPPLAKAVQTVTAETQGLAQDAAISKEMADEIGEVVDVKPEAAEEIEFRFKQALHGLTPEKLDLRSTGASKVQLDAPAVAVAPIKTVMPTVVPTNAPVASIAAPPTTIPTANAESNDSSSGLNINRLLRQYANHTAEQSGQTVNYYALAERTRLQKWMSSQSLDDLLDHAQKAYAQAYPNVAHHILNEVILRGNAAQSTQALDLRNQWHIQYLRQQAQESRGH